MLSRRAAWQPAFHLDFVWSTDCGIHSKETTTRAKLLGHNEVCEISEIASGHQSSSRAPSYAARDAGVGRLVGGTK